MSGENDWHKKREIQHDAHNRKAGAAVFWKQKRNRGQRRRNQRVAKERADSFNQPTEPRAVKPARERRQKPPKNQKTISRFADYLSEEDIEKLRRIS